MYKNQIRRVVMRFKGEFSWHVWSGSQIRVNWKCKQKVLNVTEANVDRSLEKFI